MLVIVNAPPITKIKGIAKEYRWLDNFLVKTEGRVDDYYLIEPQDWSDPTHFGINMIVNDFVEVDSIPQDVHDKCIDMGLTPVEKDTMYAKIDKTYQMIFDAMDKELHQDKMEVLFPLPWSCPPEQVTIFVTMRMVLNDKYKVTAQVPIPNKSGEAVAVRYTVRKKDEEDAIGNSLAEPDSDVYTDNANGSGSYSEDLPEEKSSDVSGGEGE